MFIKHGSSIVMNESFTLNYNAELLTVALETVLAIIFEDYTMQVVFWFCQPRGTYGLILIFVSASSYVITFQGAVIFIFTTSF